MMPRTLQTGEHNPLSSDAWRHLAGVGFGTLGLAWWLSDWLDAGAAPIVLAASACAAAATALFVGRSVLERTHPFLSFGSANRITLLRAGLVVLLMGLLLQPASVATAWLAVTIASVSALLDAFDGPAARRSGMASRFGARFDMETDALLILVLSVLAWRWDRAGAWVLLSGLMRYGFVLAGSVLPWLRRELAPSRRRQTVSVVQGIGLIVCLVPWLPAPASAAIAAFSLALLCYSFGVDCRALAMRRSIEEAA
jgi:phosphatidylglycerophosphate synthase